MKIENMNLMNLIIIIKNEERTETLYRTSAETASLPSCLQTKNQSWFRVL